MRGKLARLRSEEAPVSHQVQGHAQLAIIFIPKCDEAEGLQASVAEMPHWTQHFRHAVNWARAGLERDFDEVAVSQLFGQSQKSTGSRNGLEFASSALAVF